MATQSLLMGKHHGTHTKMKGVTVKRKIHILDKNRIVVLKLREKLLVKVWSDLAESGCGKGDK